MNAELLMRPHLHLQAQVKVCFVFTVIRKIIVLISVRISRNYLLKIVENLYLIKDCATIA
nr:unnamed protein product [Callosobruchus analis]